MDILNDLNTAQTEAVTSTEGFVRVIAGAGSGKTRALTRRFAYLVNEIGILPGNILCVTFTNKSAGEMQRRIHMLTGDNDTGYINTFHGFCVSVLQEDSYAVNYPKSFLVLDNSDIDSMLKTIYDERGLTLRDMTFSNARDMIEIKKLKDEPDYYKDLIKMTADTLREKYMTATTAHDIIFYGYLYQEKKCFGLDYNDLIKFTLYIFEQNAEIRQKWQQRLEYIMIDEFQDIDEPQYELMKVLSDYHKNLFIVGDPDQTIYTWRGAKVEYLLDFDQRFPNVKTIMMNENYRSTPEIIAVVNSLIDKNKNRIKKELVSMLPHGNEVTANHAKTAKEEAAFVADKIEELTALGVKPGDMTVLYRAHYVTRTLEDVFLERKIPYTIYSGVQFFERMEIKDALSYLRMIAYKDDLSFLRIVNTPKRNIGEKRIKLLQEYANNHSCSLYQALSMCANDEEFKKTKAEKFIRLIESFAQNVSSRPISEVLTAVLDESGYEEMLRTEGGQERLDNLAELKQSVYEYEITCGEEGSMEQYLSHVALFSNSDALSGADKVKLMTIHAAKGLEFPYVFLCAMNEGIIPSKKTKTFEGMEEERRLAFVAMTRAKIKLFISEAEGENHDNSFRYPSRFVLDIDKGLLSYCEEIPEGLIGRAKEQIEYSDKQLAKSTEKPRYEVGQRVMHSIFGAGEIREVNEVKKAYLVHFDGINTSRMIAFRARLDVEEKA